jgi:N-acyl-phosphatidylethanolamine-hydrolysing phospholipase D
MKYLTLVTLPAILLTLAAVASNGSGQAPAADHRDGGRFVNPHVETSHGGLLGYLRARFFGGDDWASYDAARDGPIPRAEPAIVPPGTATSNAAVTWIGHATVLIQHQGVNVLTDPILPQYASPLPFDGPRRRSAPALTLDGLPHIDVVVISHNHYDHLDAPTIRALGNGPRYFVPLGIGDWLVDRGIDPARVTEMDWWDTDTLRLADTEVEVIATPSQHFSGRSLTDRNRTLWAAWAIRWNDFSVWFGGDTGYNDVQFRATGERLGAVDLGIIPIGAYLPRSFMRVVHVDPVEAVMIHRDIRARRSIGVHWGTFELAAEPLLEPPQALKRATAEAGLPPAEFTTFAVGETRFFGAAP